MRLSCTLPAVALLVACAVVDSSQAQQADFARKTVTIYIGNTAGGTYDLMGRLVARHLGHFCLGNPTVVPENMPGAGSPRGEPRIQLLPRRTGRRSVS